MHVCPTVGFNVEMVDYKGITFTIWDLGGENDTARRRAMWRSYYQNMKSLIFVIDSNDEARFDIAKEELSKILSEDALREVNLLVLANKQDIPTAKTAAEITDKLGLDTLKDRSWYIQACCATTGDGLFEALDWLGAEMIREK